MLILTTPNDVIPMDQYNTWPLTRQT